MYSRWDFPLNGTKSGRAQVVPISVAPLYYIILLRHSPCPPPPPIAYFVCCRCRSPADTCRPPSAPMTSWWPYNNIHLHWWSQCPSASVPLPLPGTFHIWYKTAAVAVVCGAWYDTPALHIIVTVLSALTVLLDRSLLGNDGNDGQYCTIRKRIWGAAKCGTMGERVRTCAHAHMRSC